MPRPIFEGEGGPDLLEDYTKNNHLDQYANGGKSGLSIIPLFGAKREEMKGGQSPKLPQSLKEKGGEKKKQATTCLIIPNYL